MRHALISLSLADPGRLLTATGGAMPTLTPFGRWLREQLRHRVARQPGLVGTRLRFAGCRVTLLVAAQVQAPPLVVALVVARALREETTIAARRAGWIEEGEALWGVAAESSLVVALTSARATSVRWPAAGTVRSSTRRRGPVQ